MTFFFTHVRKYYEKDALMADPEYGSVLSHLLGELAVAPIYLTCLLLVFVLLLYLSPN